MSAHTPGPWIAGEDIVVADNPRIIIATTWGAGGPRDREINHANTRLIAAATDLLAALTKLSNEVVGCWSAYEPELRDVMGHTNYSVVAERVEQARNAIAKATP